MKNILILMLVTFVSAYSQNGDQAKKLLEEVSAKMNSYDNVYVKFDYMLENKEEDVQQALEGDVTLQGEKYVVNLFGSNQIFDGLKTYTIIPENEEVNISEPDADDKNNISPSKFITFYKNGYTFVMGDLKNIGGKQVQFVQLVPIDTNSEMALVIVGIDNKSKHIYNIKQIGKNKIETTLTVRDLKIDQNLNNGMFVFDQKKYEDLGYIIND